MKRFYFYHQQGGLDPGPVNRSLCGLLLLTGIRTCRRYTGRVWMPGEVFPVVPTQQFQLFFKMLHIGITEPHKSLASLLFFSFLRIIQRLGFTGHNKMLDFILPKVFGYFHRIILAKRLIFRRVGGCGGIKALDFFFIAEQR